MAALMPFLLAAFGLVIGSFLATVAVRWPAGRGLGGRSVCDGCATPLRARDLVPLLSWLAQRGRCRHCSAAIDPAHPAVELACALIGLGAALLVPGWQALAWAGFGWTLVLLLALDIRALWLPDVLTLPLAAAGLALAASTGASALTDRLIGGALGFASLTIVAFLYKRLRHRDGMGGGDPKLFGAIGAWLGWQLLPHVLLAACMVGIVIVALRAARGERVVATDALPFGALLAMAALAVAPVVLLAG